MCFVLVFSSSQYHHHHHIPLPCTQRNFQLPSIWNGPRHRLKHNRNKYEIAMHFAADRDTHYFKGGWDGENVGGGDWKLTKVKRNSKVLGGYTEPLLCFCTRLGGQVCPMTSPRCRYAVGGGLRKRREGRLSFPSALQYAATFAWFSK